MWELRTWICKRGRGGYKSLKALRLWGHVQTHGIKFCLLVPSLLNGNLPLWSLFMRHSVDFTMTEFKSDFTIVDVGTLIIKFTSHDKKITKSEGLSHSTWHIQTSS